MTHVSVDQRKNEKRMHMTQKMISKLSIFRNTNKMQFRKEKTKSCSFNQLLKVLSRVFYYKEKCDSFLTAISSPSLVHLFEALTFSIPIVVAS